jgi:predicted site-specific integrase-resolvase
MPLVDAIHTLENAIATNNAKVVEVNLADLTDQDLVVLLTRFPKTTCPIIRGVTDEQRTRLSKIMRRLANNTM